MDWTPTRARRVLAEIFEDNATLKETAAPEARREDLAAYLDELGFPDDAAFVRSSSNTTAASPYLPV